EMSFAGEDDVMDTAERLTAAIFRETVSVDLHLPRPRLTYNEAIARYGSDKPDTRFGLELIDIGDLAGHGDFEVFREVLRTGGQVKGINVKRRASFSRKEIDDLGAFVKRFGAQGLSWMKVTEEGVQSSIVKFFPEAIRSALTVRMGAEPDDLLLFVADTPQIVASALGNLRLELGRKLGLIQEGRWDLLWVTRFPLLEYDEEEKRYVAAHHPFTSPVEEDIERMESDPAGLRARAYDLVLNGWEIAGGSVRIFQRALQNRMFALLGISEGEAQEKFGFLLDAFEHGAPPHGGIAFGFDRLIALLAGERFIRDVIAFPKTNNALSLMDGSPSEVTKTQLNEIGLRVVSSAAAT
ncbi:MAG: aspartate--tRNA ligase, partial [Candidatus Latescibacteria bacterium]|nr:aspartate--tRNA ligase [Candidatus Latescibacterota bacterium]